MTACILSKYRKDGCEACTDLCAHRIAIEGRIRNANIPTDYRNLTLANSPARESQAKVYGVLEQYVDIFRSGEVGGRSLYLWSESPGTGKTTTASALLHEWIAVKYLDALKRGVQPSQTLGYFLDVNDWQTMYNEFNRPRVPDSIAEPAAERYYLSMEKARIAEFAIFDDIGVRDASDNFRPDLHAIINDRVSNGKPTVFTSNLPIEEMADVFDARLYDRIRDRCGSIHFVGESKRGRR